MERTEWTDARLDDAFDGLKREIADMRTEMRQGFSENAAEHRAFRAEMMQMKLAMLGGYAAIVAAIIATNA